MSAEKGNFAIDKFLSCILRLIYCDSTKKKKEDSLNCDAISVMDSKFEMNGGVKSVKKCEESEENKLHRVLSVFLNNVRINNDVYLEMLITHLSGKNKNVEGMLSPLFAIGLYCALISVFRQIAQNSSNRQRFWNGLSGLLISGRPRGSLIIILWDSHWDSWPCTLRNRQTLQLWRTNNFWTGNLLAPGNFTIRINYVKLSGG